MERLVYEHHDFKFSEYTPYVSQKSQNCFCQNFVNYPPTLIIFGRKMAKTIELYRMHSFSTSPNLRQRSVKVTVRLQRVQNNAARLICNQPHGSHSLCTAATSTSLAAPIASRIQYKLCRLMYDVYHGTAPSYLRELCHVCNDDRLRSTQRGNFSVVKTRTKLADGAFTVAGLLCFYRISKLTCTIDILTALWVLKFYQTCCL